jgi:hypothetical protein
MIVKIEIDAIQEKKEQLCCISIHLQQKLTKWIFLETPPGGEYSVSFSKCILIKRTPLT